MNKLPFALSMLCASVSCFALESTVNFDINLNRLDSVSCDKTSTQCVAVGFGLENHLQDRLVYTSQDGGKTWSSSLVLASPKEELAPKISNHPNHLSVNCDESGQNCIIVTSAIIERIPTPIVYSTENGGLTWSEPKLLPLPKTINKKQTYKNDSLLVAISCDQSGTLCSIAGGYTGADEYIPFIYSTTDAGNTWKLYSSLKTPSYLEKGIVLSGVSCSFSGQNCIAVGYAQRRDGFFANYYSPNPIAYYTHDAGAHWSKPKVLSRPEAQYNKGTLSDVFCDGSGMQCVAVGNAYDYLSDKYDSLSYITRNGGEDWENFNLIMPQAGEHKILAVSCDDSANHCTAVGWSLTDIAALPVIKSLVYTTNDAGKHWDKNTPLSVVNSSALNDVFCNNSGHCVAVGTHAESTDLQLIKRMRDFMMPLRPGMQKLATEK